MFREIIKFFAVLFCLEFLIKKKKNNNLPTKNTQKVFWRAKHGKRLKSIEMAEFAKFIMAWSLAQSLTNEVELKLQWHNNCALGYNLAKWFSYSDQAA